MTQAAVESPRFVTRENIGKQIDWRYFVDALEQGHGYARAQIADVFLGPPGGSLLSRAAWIEGLGYGVKSVTAMAENTSRGLPSIQGAMLVFDDALGSLKAIIDSELVTNLKTAADSALGARYLARRDSKSLLVIGAGSVAANIVAAYSQLFPALENVMVWNRTAERATALAADLGAQGVPIIPVTDLPAAVGWADIISTATMSHTPVLLGDWVGPGTHVDLIGAFRAEMREADDSLLQKSRLFVDSRETTLHHIGEIKIPLESGAITEEDILGDLYDLAEGCEGRKCPEDITVFKNGGGAHLDLMTAYAILNAE